MENDKEIKESSFFPVQMEDAIKKIGEKSGAGFCNLVDRIVDKIFKKR